MKPLVYIDGQEMEPPVYIDGKDGTTGLQTPTGWRPGRHRPAAHRRGKAEGPGRAERADPQGGYRLSVPARDAAAGRRWRWPKAPTPGSSTPPPPTARRPAGSTASRSCGPASGRPSPSRRVANPGCHATGFISIVYPLRSGGRPVPRTLSCPASPSPAIPAAGRR